MIKKSLLFAAGIMLAAGAYANVLTPEAALQRANAQGNSKRHITALAQPKLSFTKTTVKGEPAVYVFSNPQGGAVLLSASDKALPVLGYTDSGNFDPNNVPPQMQYWLDEYAAQIAYAEENDLLVKDTNVGVTFPLDWEYIAPLCKTQWNQGIPFNSQVPYNYATGCVAVAMSQVMKYWNYPEVGHGKVSYVLDGAGSLSMDLGEQPFKWDEMLDSYSGSYTSSQVAAVAYLMKACGYSTSMQYTAYGSGTQVERAAVALVENFGYNKGIGSVSRQEYSLSEWAQLLYDQLKNYGPVIYSGHAVGNLAHAFIADGYDGNGYFHINWGWSGLCDGFYSLDALVPVAQGLGGTSRGGYNYTQGMIINITKEDGGGTFEPKAEITIVGNMSASNAGPLFTFHFAQGTPGVIYNTSLINITPEFGIKVENTETGDAEYLKATQYFLFNGSYQQLDVPMMGPGSYIDYAFRPTARIPGTLPDGRYKISLVWRPIDTETWIDPVSPTGFHNYVYATKAGTKYTIENLPVGKLIIEKAELATPLYFGNPAAINLTITNPTDEVLTRGIVPVLTADGHPSFEGDSRLVTLEPGETINTTMVFSFPNSVISGGSAPTTTRPYDFELGFFDYGLLSDEDLNNHIYGDALYGYYGTVTMYRSNTSASMRLESIRINNAVEEEPGAVTLYGINDFSNISLSVTVLGVRGYMASPLSVDICEYNQGANPENSILYAQTFPELAHVNIDETQTLKMHINLRDYDVSKIYSLRLYNVKNDNRYFMGEVRLAASSGVEGVVANEDALTLSSNGQAVLASSAAGIASVTVYDLSGKTVAAQAYANENGVELDLTSLPRGIYVVRAADKAGNAKTLKITK